MKKGRKKISKKKLIQRRKKIIRYLIISLALLCLILVSFFTYNTYSLWTETYSQKEQNVITSGCFELQVTDIDEDNQSTAINLKNAYPMSDARGAQTKPYILNITNVCDVPSEYSIILNEFEESTISSTFIKIQTNKMNVSPNLSLLSEIPSYELDENIKYEIENINGMLINQSYNLATGFLNKNETETYEVRMWLDYNADNNQMNKRFEAGITVIATSPK